MLTLVASHFGLFDPKRVLQNPWLAPDRHRDRPVARRRSWWCPSRIGPHRACLPLPGYKTSYDTRPYMPDTAAANVGYTAAERHFSRAAAGTRAADDRNGPRHA